MDADAPPARDVADDGIARHWLAALGVAHHQAIDTLDADAARRTAHSANESLDGARLRGEIGDLLGEHDPEGLRHRDVALPDRRNEVLRIVETERLCRGVEERVV